MIKGLPDPGDPKIISGKQVRMCFRLDSWIRDPEESMCWALRWASPCAQQMPWFVLHTTLENTTHAGTVFPLRIWLLGNTWHVKVPGGVRNNPFLIVTIYGGAIWLWTPHIYCLSHSQQSWVLLPSFHSYYTHLAENRLKAQTQSPSYNCRQRQSENSGEFGIPKSTVIE